MVLFSGLEQWFTFSFCGVEGGIVCVDCGVCIFVGFYYCGILLLWGFIIVGFYYCRILLMWDCIIAGLYYCGFYCGLYYCGSYYCECRGKACKHLQCFDAENYINFHEKQM